MHPLSCKRTSIRFAKVCNFHAWMSETFTHEKSTEKSLFHYATVFKQVAPTWTVHEKFFQYASPSLAESPWIFFCTVLKKSPCSPWKVHWKPEFRNLRYNKDFFCTLFMRESCTLSRIWLMFFCMIADAYGRDSSNWPSFLKGFVPETWEIFAERESMICSSCNLLTKLIVDNLWVFRMMYST